jgi:hypothetical protein
VKPTKEEMMMMDKVVVVVRSDVAVEDKKEVRLLPSHSKLLLSLFI